MAPRASAGRQSWRVFTNLRTFLERGRESTTQRLCVAAADDHDTLVAVSEAVELDLVEPILVGEASAIRRGLDRVGMSPKGVEVIDCVDPAEIASSSAEMVGHGEADLLMKGRISTADIMRAILDPDAGLRIDGGGEGGRRRLISHLALFDIPGFDRLIGLTDAGINIAPDLDSKKDIIRNAAEAFHILLGTTPRVAALAAIEKVNKAMPATVEARELEEAAGRGELGDVWVEGPLALDCAVDQRAAQGKGLKGDVAGRADVLLVPDIEAGNISAKSITYFGRGIMVGILVGTKAPVILNSRVDVPAARLASILAGVLLAQK